MAHRIARRSPLYVAAPALLALVIAACGGDDDPSTAEPPAGDDESDAEASGPMTQEEICAAGAEEGGFVHWHNHNPENIEPIYDAFNEVYPDIEPRQQEMTPDDAAQRVLTEHLAGQGVPADIMAGQADVFAALVSEGMQDTELDWTEYGVPEDVVHSANMIRIHRIALGLGYNTDALSPEDLPNTWEELIDEKWRGDVIVDPRGRPFDQMSLLWGNDDAIDFIERLQDVVAPLVIEGGTAGLVAVAGGEADITTGGRSAEILEQQADGVPLEMKYLDIVPTIDNYNLVLTDAENINAARCYAIWFSTAGGQELYNELEFKTNDTIPTAAPDGAQVVTVETDEEAEAVSEIGREMGRIWTGQ